MIASAVFFFRNRQLRQEKEEHKKIYRILAESDERAKKLLEKEDIKELEITFIKHPESEKFNNKEFSWNCVANNTIKIPIIDEFIVPSDRDKRLFYLAHEINHLKKTHSFLQVRACKHMVRSCLEIELKADIGAQKDLEEIDVKLNDKYFWSKVLKNLQKQCKNCLQLIEKGECPYFVIKRIEKWLGVIDQISGINSEKIIFQQRKITLLLRE